MTFKTIIFTAIFFSLGTRACTERISNPGKRTQSNILFIMSDDHAANAIGAYNRRLSAVARTPNIDSLAEEGVLAGNVFCTNSICVPSRATILTGQYSHINGVKTLRDSLSPEYDNVAKRLQQAGYETAVVGKWHLKQKPAGFDYYEVLKNQGLYNNPTIFKEENYDLGGRQYEGHTSDIITDLSIEWLRNREDKSKPFMLMTHFKSVHEPFFASSEMRQYFIHDIFPEPEDLLWEESPVGKVAEGWPLEILGQRFLNNPDRYAPPALETEIPADDATLEEGAIDTLFRKATYQKFIRNYLQGVAGIDHGIGRLIDALRASGQLDDTVVIYTSDQGYFLGEHNLFDKRFMYEESLRMPFIVRYPGEIPAGTVIDDIITNVDFAPLLLSYAGEEVPGHMQGASFRKNLSGESPDGWRQSMYYHYWTADQPVRPAHLGIRTHRYKLIYFYGLLAQGKNPDDCWELYDLVYDPHERVNIYSTARPGLVDSLKMELKNLQSTYGDTTVQY